MTLDMGSDKSGDQVKGREQGSLSMEVTMASLSWKTTPRELCSGISQDSCMNLLLVLARQWRVPGVEAI